MPDNENTTLITPLDDQTGRELEAVRAPGTFVPQPVTEEEPKAGASFGELMGAAKDTEWAFRDTESITNVFKDYDRTRPKATEGDWKALDDSYDVDQLESLRELVDDGATLDEWNDQLEEFSITNAGRRLIQENGFKGGLASVSMAIGDPTFLGAVAGSIVAGDKVSGVLLAGSRAKRMASLTASLVKMGFTANSKRTRAAIALAETALADGTYASLKNQSVSDYSDMDMTIDLLAGLAIVGGFEGLTALKAARAADALTEVNAANVASQIGQKAAEGGTKDAGAAQTKSTAGKYRFDDYGRAQNSGNSEYADFAEKALQDAVGGGSHSAAATAARGRDHFIGEVNTAFIELEKANKKITGRKGMINQAKELNALSEKVWEAVVMGVDHGPDVAKAAAVIRKQNPEMLQGAKDAELRGFKDIDVNPNYMKQEWDDAGVRAARTGEDALSEDQMVELIYKGLDDVDEVPLAEHLDQAKAAFDDYNSSRQVTRDAAHDVADEAGDTLAKEIADIESLIAARKRLAFGFTRRLLNNSDSEARHLNELLEDEDSLVKWLKEDDEFRGVSDEELKATITKAMGTRTAKSKANVVDRAKRRISINPAAEIKVGARTHRVADLMNRDALGLQQSYIHEMTGNIAFAQRLGIKGPKDWAEMKSTVHAKEIEIRNGASDAKAKADERVKKMEEMKREVFGHNRFKMDSAVNRWASVLMKYNFLTTMGKAAFSAMSELGRIMGENRVRNVLKVLPSMSKILTDSFRTVNKHDTIVKEVNAFNASIGDEHLIRHFNSFDETGVKEGRFTDGMLNKTEVLMHRSARLMAKASLLAPMDKMLRMVSFQSSMNDLYSHLIKGKKSRKAFDEMGMSPDLRWRIKAQMQLHKPETDFWGNVTKLNIEKWDKQTADDMMNAMTVDGARQVQKTIAGENTLITSHPVGRIAMQFRKFAIDSYAKHLRADIRSARNGQALRVMLTNMYAVIMAGIGYVARTYVSTLGMDEKERKEVLDEKLAPDRLISNMAAYTPSLGPLVTGWNGTIGHIAPDLVIPVSRASGLGNTWLASNPSTNAIDRFGSMLHDVPGAKKENLIDKGRFAVPFQNTIWGDAILNSASQATK